MAVLVSGDFSYIKIIVIFTIKSKHLLKTDYEEGSLLGSGIWDLGLGSKSGLKL